MLLPFYIRRQRINSKIKEDLHCCLSDLGIAQYEKTRVSQLSGGERQRVCVARAIMSEADYILADEPTGALDTETGSDLVRLLSDLRDLGRGVVMVTHDLDLARFADRRFEMTDGSLYPYDDIQDS